MFEVFLTSLWLRVQKQEHIFGLPTQKFNQRLQHLEHVIRQKVQKCQKLDQQILRVRIHNSGPEATLAAIPMASKYVHTN